MGPSRTISRRPFSKILTSSGDSNRFNTTSIISRWPSVLRTSRPDVPGPLSRGQDLPLRVHDLSLGERGVTAPLDEAPAPHDAARPNRLAKLNRHLQRGAPLLGGEARHDGPAEQIGRAPCRERRE